jgi:peptidyl-prolyl cis-trans isomerase SurA
MTIKTCIKRSIAITALLFGSFTYAKTLDSIVAVVSDDVVTQLELDARITLVKNQYRSSPNVLPSESVLRTQILDALILESLQLQLAEKANLVIPDQQIDTAISNLASRQNASVEQYLQAVRNSGQSISGFRKQVERELTINELQQQIVGRQIFIADTEVERFLSSQSGQSLQDTQYQLTYLRLEAGQLEDAIALRDDLNNGGSLENVENSRDLGMRPLAEIPSIFQTLVPVLNIGEAVFLERDGVIHFTQLRDKTQTNSLNVEEFFIRHILVNTDALFTDESAQALLNDLKSQIESGADMASLADEYSQDPGTRGRGGELGWSSLDNFVQEFTQVAKSLPLNQLSDVFKSPYGYHILRVEEKRSRDVGLDVLKTQIRNQIYQQRYAESLQRWLTELRAESFVEMRQP